MIKYEFPCYPGDEVWYIERYKSKAISLGKDTIQMVSFTTRSIQIKLCNHQAFNKTFTWGKDVFFTYEEAFAAYSKAKGEY